MPFSPPTILQHDLLPKPMDRLGLLPAAHQEAYYNLPSYANLPPKHIFPHDDFQNLPKAANFFLQV